MNIITCASYYGCGSSAVTDLISEYSGVSSLGEYEFRFLHDIDGISDLEFHLTECPNRHNSGHALKRFKRLSMFNAGKWFNSRYEPFFNGQYMKLTNEYITALSYLTYKGQWFYDYFDKGTYQYYLIQFINKILGVLHLKKWRLLSNELTYGTIIENHYFIECTQKYVHKLLECANLERSKYLMIDQLMPSSNIDRCLRYVPDDVYVFVVDRDPRDLYIMGKYVWVNEYVMPVDDINVFCKWIRFTRGCAKKQQLDSKHIMHLKFEDMIYRYRETKDAIISMVGLSEVEHISPFTKFNPCRSVVNTQSWLKYPEERDNIAYIERELSEFLFDYSSVANCNIEGIPCDNKTNF